MRSAAWPTAKSEPYRRTYDLSPQFGSALILAATALRGTGHRPTTQTGHHVKAIESLELTVKADPRLIQKLKTFNHKRNRSSYDMAGAVSDQELEAMIKLARELRANVVSWLKAVHPELLRG